MRLVACANCHTQYDVSGIVAKSFPCRCGETVENRPPEAVDAKIHRCGSCGALVTPDVESCDYCGSAIVRDPGRLSLICPECCARNAASVDHLPLLRSRSERGRSSHAGASEAFGLGGLASDRIYHRRSRFRLLLGPGLQDCRCLL